ncbi:DUF6445 family protein [Silvimonas amylolytica]|uniref:Tetratricopeptide repeat protein n=1 Tax=Silvimonas amylolytica TaxID=449663 RepID=A0ABQ2PP26_9NEIS|nr:DUF6445 family protein [Silvimonas amylolytica]GGP27212.1 hypothetical protein GCM10010971_30310 [Silvimonas amylolytica]
MGEKKRRLAAGGAAVAEARPAINDGSQWVETGKRLHHEGRLPEALAAYQRALERNPQQADALHYQGLALIGIGQGAVGMSLLQRSLALEPENASFHFNLSQHLRRHDPAAAFAHLQRAVALQPADLQYTLDYAQALVALGKRDEALDALVAVRPHHPESGALGERIVDLAWQLERLELARATAADVARQHPQFEARFRIGYALPRKDQPESETAMGADQWGQCALAGAALEHFIAERDLHVIDQFIADPVAYREHALQQAFHANLYEGQNFPGVQTDGQPAQEIMERIATALGCPVKWSSPDNGAFRVSVANAKARTDIHIDNEDQGQATTYAAVLYLNPPEQCQGGTTFWQHRATGWDRRQPEDVVRAAGFKDFAAFQDSWSVVSADGKRDFGDLANERDIWQVQAEIPMRSNRIVIYRGNFYHGLSSVFGSTMQDGRLAQLFFFETARDAKV